MDEMWKKMERAAADKLMRKALWRKALQRHPQRGSSTVRTPAQAVHSIAVLDREAQRRG